MRRLANLVDRQPPAKIRAVVTGFARRGWDADIINKQPRSTGLKIANAEIQVRGFIHHLAHMCPGHLFISKLLGQQRIRNVDYGKPAAKVYPVCVGKKQQVPRNGHAVIFPHGGQLSHILRGSWIADIDDVQFRAGEIEIIALDLELAGHIRFDRQRAHQHRRGWVGNVVNIHSRNIPIFENFAVRDIQVVSR